jgi:Fic family protein
MYDPRFTITNSILKNIGTIEAAREVIADAPLLPLWEKRFRDDAVIRTAHHGTHIEGNRLNLSEAQDVLMGKDVVGRARDVQEVINYRRTLQVIEEESKKDLQRITEGTIKKLHRSVVDGILLPEQIGEYRTKQVVIKSSETGEVTFKPPTPVEVPFLMREFLYWVNKPDTDIHPILKAAIAHHELVRIHPFIDGNGRVSRALSTLILFLEKYDIRQFFSLEEYYDKDAITYYENLQKANEGDLSPWIDYFVLGVAIEFERIKKKILKLSKDTYLKEKLGGKQVFLSERQTKIIEYIQSIGYLQNQMFGEVIDEVSEDTILRDLNDLMEKGIIKKVGKTKASRYVMI